MCNFRQATHTRGDVSTEKDTSKKRREEDDQTQRLPTSIIQDSGRENSNSALTAVGKEELSFTQSTASKFSNKT